MTEFSDYKDKMSMSQRVIATRLEKLWDSVESARQSSYPNTREEDLPRSYQQRYLAIKYRIQEIMVDMISNSSYFPDEAKILGEIRIRILKFLEENDLKENYNLTR